MLLDKKKTELSGYSYLRDIILPRVSEIVVPSYDPVHSPFFDMVAIKDE